MRRHRSFWERGEDSFLQSVGVFAPSTPIALPRAGGEMLTHAERLTPDMIDVSAMIDQIEALPADELDSSLAERGIYLVSVGLGDQMPLSRPLPKIPWVEAMLGCPIVMTEGHIWNKHYPGDPAEVIARGANFEHNPWLQLYLEFLKQLQARLSRRFLVSANTLLRGASDLAAAVMGVQEACVGWIDQPAFMARLLRVCTDALLTVIEAGYKVLKPFQGGYPCNWNVWAPAPVVWTQADHASLISARMYEQQILPYDVEVIRSCPVSVLHLHNSNLHIAPLLVQVPELTALECILDPYPTGERRLWEIKMLQMILEHKALFLDANFPTWEESQWVLEQMPRRGLCFNPRFDHETFAGLPAGLPGSQTWILD